MSARRPTMPKTKSNRIKKNEKANKPMSLAEKMAKATGLADGYIDPVPEISDDEVRKSLFPESKIMVTRGRNSVTCDSCPSPQRVRHRQTSCRPTV